ncbi:GGDEF domain-containing protein [Paracidovorax sp. MALMAid1276]|uniref:GGDEF domain-containing protein n=1 Tax=Paracidovorax sp. MALMAid1276 TaxID=3411631 RepID=UPI003B99D0B8
MHSPTLIILAALLSVLVTVVLFAVWCFNRQIPGLRVWVLAFVSSSVFSASLLARDWVPVAVSVFVAQVSVSLTGYLCWMGSRAYMGRSPPPHGVAALALAGLTAAALYFTVERNDPGVRFMLLGLMTGVCFILTARTLAHGGFHRVPARYLLAGIVGGHGVFVLIRPLAFALVLPQPPVEGALLSALSYIVVLEATGALVLIGFGAVMLTNEFITNELRHLAEVDPLTNVFNRRAFLTLLDKAISSAQRTGQPLPVLVLDVDHFKQVNDSHGHQCGDEVLRHFVRVAQRCLRKEDAMGRLGGEEFGIFLPNADGAGALAVAERLRALVENTPVRAGAVALLRVTVSIGVTLAGPADAPDTALQRADEAMYLAKQRGRNRVEMSATAPAKPAVGLSAAA